MYSYTIGTYTHIQWASGRPWGLGTGRPNCNEAPLPWGLGPSVGPGGAARTAMGHRRRRCGAQRKKNLGGDTNKY